MENKKGFNNEQEEDIEREEVYYINEPGNLGDSSAIIQWSIDSAQNDDMVVSGSFMRQMQNFIQAEVETMQLQFQELREKVEFAFELQSSLMSEIEELKAKKQTDEKNMAELIKMLERNKEVFKEKETEKKQIEEKMEKLVQENKCAAAEIKKLKEREKGWWKVVILGFVGGVAIGVTYSNFFGVSAITDLSGVAATAADAALKLASNKIDSAGRTNNTVAAGGNDAEGGDNAVVDGSTARASSNVEEAGGGPGEDGFQAGVNVSGQRGNWKVSLKNSLSYRKRK